MRNIDLDGLVIDNTAEGLFRVNRWVFTDPDILELERQRVFEHSWIYAGHESEIPQPGDFRARNVAGRPVVLVCGSDGQVRVLLNTCTHRGALVCRQPSGNTKSFQCLYHAWTFSNQGELIGVPGEEAYSAAFDRRELALAMAPRLESYRGFVTNVVRYYEYIREHDLTLTHALINLQRSRPAAELFQLSEETALHVVRETNAGLVLRGARVLATLAPLAEEIAIYSPRMRRMKPEEERRYALAFAIPCGTPGLKFLCRESFDLGRSHFDHPLGSRFEEMDCIVFFDEVLVPWERVFLLGDVERLNEMMTATHMTIHTGHQGGAKNVAKCEFLLGVALLMAHTLGSTQQPHVQERLAELMVHTEVMKACLRAVETDAQLDRWGVMCPAALPLEAIRTLFMTVYPRMVEILQLLGSSSFMLIPSEADFQGPLTPEIERYLATDTAEARERVKLFRLAWDIAGSAFGSRQVLYERFFAGDPLSRAQALYNPYPKEGLMERIREFLGREDPA